MPVHSVSEITTIVSGIIKDSSLQDVWIYGKILEPPRPNRLKLGDTGRSIDCRNHGKDALFVGLEAGRKYWAYGKVIVDPQTSKYRFAVTNIQPNLPPDSSVGISSLTKKLKQTVGQPGIVQVQAKISSIAQLGRFKLLDLKDANSNRWTDGEMIECAIPPGINPRIPPNVGDDVWVRGEIKIFPGASRYQIKIANADDIMSGSRLERCKCLGCESCRLLDGRCNNKTLNPQYELCPSCYAISPDREAEVEKAVETYFSDLKVSGFSPKTQQTIKIGAKLGRVDVVLTNGNESFAAIAECKGAGYVGPGIRQLKSYLSATDTRFGIFANRVGRNQWKFYENLGGNCIPEIDCSEFEARVDERVATRERLRDEIRALESNRNQLKDEIRALESNRNQLQQKIQRFKTLLNNLKSCLLDLEL